MAAGHVRLRTSERQDRSAVAERENSVVRESVMSSHEQGLLSLQRKVGNQAVRHLLRANTQRSASKGVLQRKCATCASGSGKCKECEEEGSIQREAAAEQTEHGLSPATSVVRDGLQSQAQSLDPSTRRSMESYFGEDFGHVRLHTNAVAAHSAKQVDALAYTVGRDIVFGSDQYKPQTKVGRRLLAHELTHTIQQGHGVAFDKIGISDPGDATEREADAVANGLENPDVPLSPQPIGALRIARQQTPASPQAGAPPTPPVGPQGWLNCSTDAIKNLPDDLSAAVNWVTEAIDDLERKELPNKTSNSLSRYLTTDSGDVKSLILPTLKLMLFQLQLGPSNFRCRTQTQCDAETGVSNASAYAGNPIALCGSYFDEGKLDRVTILIHEAGHNANLGGDIYEWRWPFPGLDKKTRLGNADSFAAFVRGNKYPSVAIFEHPLGGSVGFGGLFPGGVSARYVVRGEYDILLKKRIVHFLDLHTGVQFDVDSSGSAIGTVYVGARSFAPLSLTKQPLFLDLRAGGVLGGIRGAESQFKSTTSLGFNVGGVSTEVGLGLTSGRLGAGVSYRHIFNFLTNNPDINELLISGEIRFP
jgi:Domain of unknown function (DUF4157)